MSARTAGHTERKESPMAAYLIADIEIDDKADYDEYIKRVPAVIAAHGGRYLVRGGTTKVLEGDWHPRRTVVVEFATMDALQAFWASPDYQSVLAIRERAARSNVVAVEGV